MEFKLKDISLDNKGVFWQKCGFGSAISFDNFLDKSEFPLVAKLDELKAWEHNLFLKLKDLSTFQMKRLKEIRAEIKIRNRRR